MSNIENNKAKELALTDDFLEALNKLMAVNNELRMLKLELGSDKVKFSMKNALILKSKLQELEQRARDDSDNFVMKFEAIADHLITKVDSQIEAIKRSTTNA